MTSGCRNEGPKIVHIETRYVETDAIHFSDVVQRLTGKNSSITTGCVGNGYRSAFEAGSDNNKGGIAQYGVRTKPEELCAYHATATTDGIKSSSLVSSVLLLNNVSFKDFDGLLSDLPSMEELLCL